MKSCPKCNRTFPDEGQKFCTFDGGLLIAPQTFDPNATIRATSIDLNTQSELPTSRDLPDPNATIMESYPATVALPRNTGPTTGPAGAPNTSDIARQPPQPTPPPPPPPPSPAAEASTTGEIRAPQPAPAMAAPAPSTPLPQQPVAAQKKSKLPWIVAGILLFFLLGTGALAGIFFFVVKPRLDEMAAAERNAERRAENANLSTPAPASSVEAPSPTPEDTFVPPPGTVQFANSNDNLDGKLAEHYFDFSFYYPQSWERDPKAGVPGASNFVGVNRNFSKDFPQETFAVSWYTSTGTFVGDLPSYPERVEEYSNSLAKRIPEYKKVSEGPTKINSMQGYEFRWEGLSRGTEQGDLQLWGRVVFLPTGTEGDTAAQP